jgi:hypothetical protein
MSRYSKLFIITFTKLLTVFLLMYEQIMFVEGAMARLVLDNECSAEDVDRINLLLHFAQSYGLNPDVRRRRNLRHFDQIESSLGIKDKSKRELIQSHLEKFPHPLPLNTPNTSFIVHNDTSTEFNGTDFETTVTSSRELYPAYCNDLCAGYLPRRCMVTRCVGFRRRRQQRRLMEQIQQPPPDQHGTVDACHYTISLGNMLLDLEENGFTSNCAANRTWYCMTMC